MTNSQIQYRKKKIAHVCLVLLICIAVFGTVSAYIGDKNNMLKNNISSILNAKKNSNSSENTHIYNNQKNK